MRLVQELMLIQRQLRQQTLPSPKIGVCAKFRMSAYSKTQSCSDTRPQSKNPISARFSCESPGEREKVTETDRQIETERGERGEYGDSTDMECMVIVINRPQHESWQTL